MTRPSVAHYRITDKFGAGGMGEVYRATDTRLNRQVAWKVLPQVFARDEQRIGRFEREAQVPASLNHPDIASSDWPPFTRRAPGPREDIHRIKLSVSR